MKAMLQTALREDALTATPGGFELRLGLPWIRSMPLSSLAGIAVEVDGVPGGIRGAWRWCWEGAACRQMLSGKNPAGGSCRTGWSCPAGANFTRGAHAVAVDFQLLVPYLQAGPG